MAKKKQTPEKTPKKPDINAYIAGAGELVEAHEILLHSLNIQEMMFLFH